MNQWFWEGLTPGSVVAGILGTLVWSTAVVLVGLFFKHRRDEAEKAHVRAIREGQRLMGDPSAQTEIVLFVIQRTYARTQYLLFMILLILGAFIGHSLIYTAPIQLGAVIGLIVVVGILVYDIRQEREIQTVLAAYRGQIQVPTEGEQPQQRGE